MPGKFTHFVARTLPTHSVTLCSTDVLGTTYIRDEPLVDVIKVESESLTTLTVPHIRAGENIGNFLAIKLRLSSDSDLISSVGLNNQAAATEVTIDTSDLAVGNHTLKLESFDANGGVLSTLKTDIITVTVFETTPALPTFQSPI